MFLKKIDNIILFGGSIAFIDIAKFLISRNIKYQIFTSVRHLAVKINETETLKEVLIKNKIKFYQEKDINKSKNLLKYIKNNTLGIGFGQSWDFNKQIIKKFKGNLIDYMGIPLPRYRGGAHATWMLMSKEKNNGACFQQINQFSKQGIFDSGDKIEEIKYLNKGKYPIDLLKNDSKIAFKIFKILVNKIINNKKLKITKVKEEESFFLPRLNTEKQGFLDWQNWNCSEIIDFINSFGDPYIGASTFYNKKKVYLKNAELHVNRKFHPFMCGIICKIDKHLNYYIVTKTGILKIGKISSTHKINFTLGSRLFTPNSYLDNAINFDPIYNSKGLKK
jgi:methionyl-tRNA formyltransferase